MGKSQYKREPSAASFHEKLAINSGFKTMSKMNPKSGTTTDFYKTRDKKFKQPVQIGKRKENELQDEIFTDKVFTGDNPKLTAYLTGQARDRES